MLGTFLYPGQGLGNQMWSYYALRLLAKHTDLSFSLLGMENFKGSEFISFDIGERLLAPSKKFPSEQLFAPFENYYSEKQLVNSVEYCDVRGFDKNCLMIKPNTLIDGYFQSEELVKLVAHEIDDFFSVKDIPELEYLAAADICLLNVRGGEYVRNKRLTLHKKYWDNAMHYMRSERNIVRFLVVTDDPIYASRLLPDVTILEQDMHHDFVALTKCKNVIISNSSFSYFPLRFNRQDPCIIAPKYWARHNVSDGYWACRSNIYQNYNYMDRRGTIKTSEICAREADDYIKEKGLHFYTEKHTHASKYPNRVKSFFRNRLVKYE